MTYQEYARKLGDREVAVTNMVLLALMDPRRPLLLESLLAGPENYMAVLGLTREPMSVAELLELRHGWLVEAQGLKKDFWAYGETLEEALDKLLRIAS